MKMKVDVFLKWKFWFCHERIFNRVWKNYSGVNCFCFPKCFVLSKSVPHWTYITCGTNTPSSNHFCLARFFHRSLRAETNGVTLIFTSSGLVSKSTGKMAKEGKVLGSQLHNGRVRVVWSDGSTLLTPSPSSHL